MFLTDAYFQGDLYLPNLVTTKPGTVGVGRMLSAVAESDLSYYIDKYEREFLIILLGNKLYEAFIAGLEEPDNAKWMNLKNRIYITSGPYPYSPAANFVYFNMIAHNVTTTTMKGEVIPLQDYAKNASAKQKLADAWNDILPWANRIRKFIDDNKDDYGAYIECCPCRFREFEPVNIFGI